jgi:type III pantothenate kinase
MNIVIDQGNTVCKIAIFEEKDEPVKVYTTNALTISFLNGIIDDYQPSAGIISSVKEINPEVYKFLCEKLSFFTYLSSATSLPLENAYGSPETLGMDRIAAAVGAWSICPGRPLLIIDMGTAITYDFVSEDGVFTGGNIAPGLNLRFKSLHLFTGKLPEVEASENFDSFGKDTENAIRAGVMQGILYEANGYIFGYKERFPNLFAFLTGGDLIYFAEKLKNGIFVSGNLVLIGLNRILNHNVCK